MSSTIFGTFFQNIKEFKESIINNKNYIGVMHTHEYAEHTSPYQWTCEDLRKISFYGIRN